MKSEKPVECVGCNTFDVGSIMDNSELSVAVEREYESRAEAEAALAKLTQKARDTETDPCKISSEISESNGKFSLNANFTFSCQAEVVIFQLNTRAI